MALSLKFDGLFHIAIGFISVVLFYIVYTSFFQYSPKFKKKSLPPKLSASFVGTFAYETVKDRMPTILVKTMDSFKRSKDSLIKNYATESVSDDDIHEDMKYVISELSKFRYELTHDKEIANVTSDYYGDLQEWNRDIDFWLKSKTSTYFTAPWLVIECHMYRKLNDIVLNSRHLKPFDFFKSQKEDAFYSSEPTMRALSQYFYDNQFLISLGEESNDLHFEMFQNLTYMNLWGNKYDLSISAGAKNAPAGDLVESIKEAAQSILVDESKDLYDIISKMNNLNIHIILDNSGYELFSDLILADFIVQWKRGSTVTFHTKVMGWFVSDVTPTDFYWTLNTLLSSNSIYINSVATRWKKYIEDGVWKIHNTTFWTQSYEYSRMNSIDLKLYELLEKSDLVIFKGDLNYRKLVGDRDWPTTTSFEEAVQGFMPTNICSLRTLKAEVVVGLGEGIAEKIAAINQNWLISGEYAVIQCLRK